MNEETALLAAISAQSDDDTPRLAYADWLDENRPDRLPSPALGSSARAEFIRVQCRLAATGPEDANYPELLERETELSVWLNTHDPPRGCNFGELDGPGQFETGEWADYRRGFPEVLEYSEYGDDPWDTAEGIGAALKETFTLTPARTLQLEEPTAHEIAALVQQPEFRHLRGFYLDFLDEGSEDDAVTAIAESPRSAGLRRLYLDIPVGDAGCEALAGSRHLRNLESLALDYPLPAGALKALTRAKWFPNLHRLAVWLGGGDAVRVLANLPAMPQLVSLSLHGTTRATTAMFRRFAASESFPRLAHLNLGACHLEPEAIVAIARARWPLRHLILAQNSVRKAGAEALAKAGFAETLRILDLTECEVGAGAVEALAASTKLCRLQHLTLEGNPLGPAGLAALASGAPFLGLRSLNLGGTNRARNPIAARDVLAFLSGFRGTELRHLQLDYLPVAVRGARLLATSPTFANLTRLHLRGCLVGERGTAALIASKTLTNLVLLDLIRNTVGSACGKLSNPKVLPKLGLCMLGTGVPRVTRTRLRRRPGIDL